MQMLVVYLPWLQHVFQTEALSLNDLAFIAFVASSVVALDTARKLLFPDRQGDNPVCENSYRHLVISSTLNVRLRFASFELPLE